MQTIVRKFLRISRPSVTNRRILFIHQGARNFFEKDIAILREICEVEAVDNFPPSPAKIPSLLKGILTRDVVFIWFMGRHAVLPLVLSRIFKKKVILVAGGWDVANCPEIGYGLMRPGLKAVLAKWLFKIPDVIISVSESNRKESFKNAGVHPEKSRLVYHGFEGGESLSGLCPAQDGRIGVITIGEINQSNLKRKGLEQFVRLAAHFPDVPFVLTGRWASDGAIEFLKKIATPNVQFTGFLADTELKKYLSKAKVYAQLSYHEAFGCALAEAMLHGCVPVATTQYALPEVVQGAGYLVPFGDISATVDAIRKALSDIDSGKKARQRILHNFPLEKRRRELTSVIENF